MILHFFSFIQQRRKGCNEIKETESCSILAVKRVVFGENNKHPQLKSYSYFH